MSETEQMTDYKEPINIFTLELIRIFEQILLQQRSPLCAKTCSERVLNFENG